MTLNPLRFARAAIVAIALVASGCASRASHKDATAWSNATQMIVVTTADWNATRGTLRTYERNGTGAWQERGAGFPVMVGRNGTAWGLGLHPAQAGVQKQEGDGRAPAGVFAIGEAFGYAPSAMTALPYAQMQASSWCVDVSGSPLYNRIVDADQVGAAAVKGASETMRLDLHNNGDQRYRQGFVIEHNAQGVANGGSCIFAHLWKAPGETTAGCTAMAPESMQRLYAWLQPQTHPVFVLLPESEYRHLQGAWTLP